MKYAIFTTPRVRLLFLLFALSAFGTRTAWAQISQPPPCSGQLTIYFSVSYLGCQNPHANAKVIANCIHPPIMYQWSNGTISNEILNVLPGTYSVTVSDSTGTVVTGSVTVLPPAATPFSFTATATGGSCNGNNGSITLQATGGTAPYSYRYRRNGNTSFLFADNVGATHTISNLAPGTYTVIGSDARSCRDTVEVTVGAGLQATATTLTNATCFGAANGQISVNATGGTGPYTVAWSGAASGSQAGQSLPKTLTNLPAGSYTVTVTDAAGCSGTATATITQPPALTATVTGGTLPCSGAATLTAQASGGTAPYSFAWSAPGQPTGATVTVGQAGVYVVTVTDANNCTATASFNVLSTGLQLTIKATNVSCPGGMNGSVAAMILSGGQAPFTYAWSTGANTQTVSNLGAGTYTVTVTDAAGCSASATAQITAPVMLVLTATATPVTCAGTVDSVVLSATGGTPPYQFTWDGQPAGTVITGVGAGTHTAAVVDSNQCMATTTLTVTTFPVVDSVNYSVVNVGCFGQSTGSITATAYSHFSPVTFQWSNGATGATVTNLTAGTYSVTITVANNPNCSVVNTVVITQPATALTVGIAATDALCPGDTVVTLTANPSGGTAPYAYAWSNGATTQTLTNVAPGSYTVTVTDANNCTATATLQTGPAPPPLVIGIEPSAPSCQGFVPTVGLSATGGTAPYTFTVNNQPATTPLTNVVPGIYTVQVTDQHGCTATTTTTITVPPAFDTVYYNVTDVACFGQSTGSIAPVVVTTYTPVTYQWSNGSTATSLTNVTAGTYIVTVTVQGNTNCTVVDTLTVGQPADALVVTISATTPLCPGDTLPSLQATATGGTAPYTFAWSNGATTPTLMSPAPGTYTVTVTDAKGCTATATQVVNPAPAPLVLAVEPSAPSCEGFVPTVGLSATGGTAPYTFTWSNQPATPPLTNVLPGTYTVVVTDLNGCTASTTTTITVPPAFDTVYYNVTSVACFGQSTGSITPVVVTSYTPITYQWSNASTGTALTNLTAGTYTVTITVQNNPACSVIDSIVVGQPATPLTVSISLSNLLCQGDSVVMTATATGGTAPYTYAWSNGPTTPTQTDPDPGTYTVTVTDANGCTATATQVVDQTPPQLTLTATPSAPSCQGFVPTVGLTATGGSAPYTFTWTPGVVVTPPVTNVLPGTYTPTVTDANGCTATTTVVITVPPLIDSLDYDITPPACFGDSTGSVVPVIFSQYTPVTYSWAGGLDSLVNVPAGTYVITILIQNDTSCVITDTVTVAQPPLLTVDITAGTMFCPGDSALNLQATASGGTAPYTYAWSTGATGPVLANASPSTPYTVTVTDANGCTSTATETTGPAPAPIVITVTPSAPSCEGFVPTVALSATGGTAPYTFTWADSTVVSPVTNVPAGTYVVTVTDANNCTATTSVTLTVPPVIDSVNYVITGPNCFGDSTGSVVATFYSNYTPITWTWSTGAVDTGLVNVPGGTYYVTVTVGSNPNCIFIDTVVVPQPPAIIPAISITDTLCATNVFLTLTASATGGTAPYTFVWQNDSTTTTLVNVPAGIYSVTATDANGCTGVATDTLEPIQQLEVEIVSLVPSCAGSANGAITVQGHGGTPPYTYAWAHDSTLTSPALTGLAPGSYTVTVTDANNCAADTTIAVPAIDSLDVTLTVVPAPCPGVPGGSATAVVAPGSGTGPFTYTWSPAGPADSAVLDSLLGGTVVSVTVTAANGCTGTATATVGSSSNLTVAVQATSLPCVGTGFGTATAVPDGGTAPYTFQWSGNPGGPLADSTAQLTNLAPGTYTVTVTDANGCTATASAAVLDAIQPVATFTPSITCVDNGSSIAFVDQSTAATAWSWQITIDGDSVLTLTGQAPPATTFAEGDTLNIVLTVTSASGCTDTATLTLPVFGLPVFQLLAGDTAIACSDTIPVPLTVTGSAGYSYTWSPLTGLTFATDSISAFALPDSTTQYVLTVQNGNCVLGDTVLVLVPPAIDLQVTGNHVCGDTIATVVAMTAVPATFQWYYNGTLIDSLSTFDTMSTITVPVLDSITGPYTVVVTDSLYGCTRSAAFTVGDFSFTLDSLLPPAPVCAFDSVLLSVVSSDTNATYQWYSVPNGVVFSDSTAASTYATAAAGTYTVFVRAMVDVCVVLDSVTVVFDSTQMPAGMFDVNACNGLLVAFTNPDSVLAGTWSFGDGSPLSMALNPQHQYDSAGTYVVTFVTAAGGCTGPFTAPVTVQAQPSVAVNITYDYENCRNQALIRFHENLVAGSLLDSIRWTFINGELQTSDTSDPLVMFDEEGMVMASVTATDVNGCAGTDSVEVPIDIIREDVRDTIFCHSGAVPLNPEFNADYTYQWSSSPNDLGLTPNVPNPFVQPDVYTMYTVLIENGLCQVRDTARVTPRDPAQLTAPGDVAVCHDTLITLNAQSPNAIAYAWSLSSGFDSVLASTPQITVAPLDSGQYYIRVMTAEGCFALDSVEVDNAGLLVVQPEAMRICKGETISLQVEHTATDGVVTYSWSPVLPNAPNPEVTPAATTTYSVVVSNDAGCTGTASFAIDVVAASVTAEIDGKDTICTGEFTTLVATPAGNATSYRYQWTPAGTLSDPDEPVTEARPTETTDYVVTLTADDLCPAYDTVTVYFRELTCEDPYVFVPKAFTPNGDDNNDILYVRGALIQEMYFVVWDRWGEKVFETNDKNSGWDGTFNGVASTPDAYAWYLRVNCGHHWVEMKGNVTLLK